MDGGDFFALAGTDYGDRNRIAAEAAANIDFAHDHCVAGKSPTGAGEGQPK